MRASHPQEEKKMAEIELTQGKVALVDDADYERLSQHKWYARRSRNTFYAAHSVRDAETGKVHFVYMHREIMDAKPGMEVDHVDGDGLNNQRANLRICSNAQNGMNQRKQRETSSKFKGVGWHKQHARWQARIMHKGQHIHLGYSLDEIEAAEAYDDKAREMFGQYARLNFPREGEQSALRRGA